MTKNILITGGTSGVGFAIARRLIEFDTKIILIGRNVTRAEQAIKILNSSNVSYLLGDISDGNNRANIVEKITTQLGKIDILLDCAGVYPQNKTYNIKINLQAHYYFINDVQNLLSLSDNARVLIVTGMPKPIQILPVLESQLTILGRGMWELTHKTLLMKLLANNLKEDNITVNSFFPGDVQSNLMAHSKKVANTEVPIGEYLALDSSLNNVTGQFFNNNGTIVPLKANKYNAVRAKKILGKYL